MTRKHNPPHRSKSSRMPRMSASPLFGGAMPLYVQDLPSGKWGFVGSIPTNLGTMIPASTAAVMGQRAFRHPETGELVEWKFPVFATKDEAVTFARSKGHEPKVTEPREPREPNPSRRSIHTAKWDRCVKDVKTKGGASSPYAVCTAMLGERGSIKAGHRKKNPIQDPNSSGQGYDPDHESNPYNAILIENGFHYSHSTPVTYAGGERIIHHTYKRAIKGRKEWEDRNVSVWYRPGHGWMWESSIGGSGRRIHGSTRESLEKTLRVLRRERIKNPSGFQLEKTQRLYFMVHAHPHRGGGERLWLTQSGTLSADKGKGARYTSVEVAVARAKAFLKKHRIARKYRFDVCLSD